MNSDEKVVDMLQGTYSNIHFTPFTQGHISTMLEKLSGTFGKSDAAKASPTSGANPVVTAGQMSQLLSLLYEGGMEPKNWEPFLQAVRQYLGANYTSLIIRPCEGNKLGLIVSAAEDPLTIEPYDPMLDESPLKDMVSDRVVTVQNMLSEAEWRRSIFYQQYCKKHNTFYLMGVDVKAKNGSTYALRITRPESGVAFNQQEMDFVRLLLPHLRNALSHHLSIHQDQQVISLYSHAMAQLMVGVVILDQNGIVIQSNPSASNILRMEDGLRISGGMLEATYGNDNRKLQRLIKDALVHASVSSQALTEGISVSRASGMLNWGVVVQSISPDEWTEGKQRPSVAVFMRDTEGKAHPPVKLAQQLFQLTPAETSLAIQLANGLSLEEAAEALNIRRNTARAHLRSIFSKTGVRRQTELVRIFLNSVAWLGSK